MGRDKVQENGRDVTLPFAAGELRFRRASSLVLELVSQDGGLALRWDGQYRIYVTLDPSYKNHVSATALVT